MNLRPDVESAEALDAQLSTASHKDALKPEMFSWSKTVRRVLGVGAVDLAERMGISQPAVTQLERSEAAGTISVAKLHAIADALDCELVYGFVPKRSFAATARRYEKQQEAARKAKRKVPRPTRA